MRHSLYSLYSLYSSLAAAVWPGGGVASVGQGVATACVAWAARWQWRVWLRQRGFGGVAIAAWRRRRGGGGAAAAAWRQRRGGGGQGPDGSLR